MALLLVAVLCQIASGKSKCKQIISAGIWYLVFDHKVCGHCKHICGLMISRPDFQFHSLRLSLGGENKIYFSFGVVDLLLKNNGERQEA